jgi:hypothetical protein
LHRKVGIPQVLLEAVKGLYEDDSYTVVDGKAYSEPVHPNKGVKQGCPLSPLLFSLCISDIGECWPEHVPLGVQVEGRTLTHLLYADDIALTSDCEAGLQSLLDRLLPYAQAKHLKVNISKSKVVVFGPGGGAEPRITYDGQVLPVVHEFRYPLLTARHPWCSWCRSIK